MKMSPIAALALTVISLGYASAQSSSPNNTQQGGAPPCTGRNPHVAVPTAPHGMYLWLYSLDAGRTVDLFKKHVIGKDPTLCGVSAVVSCRMSRSRRLVRFLEGGAELKPFTDAGLTVACFSPPQEKARTTRRPRTGSAEVPKTFWAA